MLIAQITDTHILADGMFAFGGNVDTSRRLRDAVAFVMRMSPLPDVVLATGDLVDTGDPGDYRQLLQLLQPLSMPVLPIPGNHDARAPFVAAFPEAARRMDTPFVQYVVDDYPLRLIAIDTLEEGRIGGRVCAARLDWLRRALEASSRPTLVFMHHPPYDFGSVANDDMRCEGGEAMAEIVSRHENVHAVLCGHLHRSTMTRWAGTLGCTVPATAPMLEVNLDGSHPHRWIDTPAMLGLHLWRDGHELVSHVVAADERERGVPFGRKAD